MRVPVFRKTFALLILALLLGLFPAYGACACRTHCEAADSVPCEEMSAVVSVEELTVGTTAMHLVEACHHSLLAPSEALAPPPSNELRGTVAVAATLAGWSADLLTSIPAPARTASLWRADRSSYRYILFASFLS